MSRAGKVSYAVLCAAGLVLAATGLGTFALGHPPMTHWVLMAHVAVAPLFALGLAAVALTWSGLCRGGADSSLSAPTQALLWVILLAGLVVALSGVVPMTPLFGGQGQHLLYLIHRYSAIVLTAAVLLHIPLWIRRKAAQGS
jgi:cytochrome b subunit of formate dehydrogenase